MLYDWMLCGRPTVFKYTAENVKILEKIFKSMRKQNWKSFLSVDSNKMELYKFNPLLSSLNQQRQKDAGQNETLDVSVQAISRCDMVSLLSSVRKKTIWEV